MAILTGKETFQVTGVQSNGIPSGATETVASGDVAALAGYGIKSLAGNNARMSANYNTMAQWVHNDWTYHVTPPAGFSNGIYATFVNGLISTNAEQNAYYAFNIRTGIYIPSQARFVQGVWSTTANIDSLLGVAWGTDTAFYNVNLPPNTGYYITCRRVAQDLGAAGTYNVITSHGGGTKRQDGILAGTNPALDYTMGVGLAYGAKALAPVINASGVITSIPIDPNNKGVNYTAGLNLYLDYGAASGGLAAQAGNIVPALTTATGYGVNGGGGVASVTVSTGGTGNNPNNPPIAYLSGGGQGFAGQTAAYGPACIFGVADTPVNSVLMLGDSNISAYGSYDGLGDNNANFGIIEQAIQNRAGTMLVGVIGSTAAGWVATHTLQVALFNYLYAKGLRINKAVIGFGVNDFATNANSNVLPYTQGNVVSIISTVKGVWPQAACYPWTITPETTSTDSWVTTANQTPITIGFGGTPNFGPTGYVYQYNNALKAGTGISNADGFIDVASIIADPTTPSKFRVAGDFYLGSVVATAFTSDGVHPNTSVGEPYIVSFLDVSMLLATTSLRNVSIPKVNYVAQVGEQGKDRFTQVLAASGVALTTATPANVCSINLQAGHYLISGQIGYTLTGATLSKLRGSTSKISATHGQPEQLTEQLIITTTLTDTTSIVLPTNVKITVPVGSTATYYLVAQANFSAGTVAAYGTINVISLG